MVQVGEVTIGRGKPKICASITERDTKSIIAAADILIQKQIDIVEWRIDFFQEVSHWEQVTETLQRLKMSLLGKPLLVTMRTREEGGQAVMEGQAYRELIDRLAESGYVRMVDVEIFQQISYEELTSDPQTVQERWEELKNWIAALREKVVVVGSYHNFEATPSDEELQDRMKWILESGADIPKMAVMPQNKMDVLRLMLFTLQESEKTDRPLITMSMGKIGSISRVAGESFGSAATFGSIGQESAPGQLPVNRLEEMLDVIHQNYQ